MTASLTRKIAINNLKPRKMNQSQSGGLNNE